MRRIALGLLLGLLILAGAGAFAAQFAQNRYTAAGPLAAARIVVVPHGIPSHLGETLVDSGVVADPREFRLAAFVTSRAGPLRAGEFRFPAGASLRDVLGILRTGRPVQHRVTIPEGLTAAAIAMILERADALTGPIILPAEGAALPQSYSYERGATREAVLERAETAMQRTLAQLWAERAETVKLASPQEMLTLASLVERETARPEERPHVAGVFLNRLRLGMRLQSDPTVVYAVSGGIGTLERVLTRADLDLANPYNTYRNTGLPPGPIASPGLAALQAVAQPAKTDDLYFVADGAGGHAFARTLEEHNRNVAKWRAGIAPPIPPIVPASR